MSDAEPEELDPYKTDRPRGILTEHERKYLLGEKESDQPWSIRQNIREHLIHSLLDFVIISQQLEERDRNKVVNEGVDPNPSTGEQKIEAANRPLGNSVGDGRRAAMAFLYQCNPSFFDKEIEWGIERAEKITGWDTDVSVQIERNRNHNLRRVVDVVNDKGPGAVSKDELTALHLNGVISTDEFVSMMNDRNESG